MKSIRYVFGSSERKPLNPKRAGSFLMLDRPLTSDEAALMREVWQFATEPADAGKDWKRLGIVARLREVSETVLMDDRYRDTLDEAIDLLVQAGWCGEAQPVSNTPPNEQPGNPASTV